jgi:hypothetical protein
LGLQGRLVVAFMLLLMMGLEADGVLYASQTSQRLVELLGEQARQLAWGLSMSSQESLVAGNCFARGMFCLSFSTIRVFTRWHSHIVIPTIRRRNFISRGLDPLP